MNHDRPPSAPLPDHTLLAAAWALRVLDPEDEAEFLAHLELEGCAECATVVSETSATLADVAGAVPQQEPPPHLRARLMAAVESERQAEWSAEPAKAPPRVPRTELSAVPSRGPQSEPAAAPSRGPQSDDTGSATVVPLRRRVVLRTVAAVAAASAVVAIGGLAVANQGLRAERDIQAVTAAQNAQIVSVMRDAGTPGALSAPLADPDGTLVGMVVERAGSAQVMTTGFAANGSDETYVLWALSGPQPTAVGTFDVPPRDASVRSVPSVASAEPVQGFAVSLEPGRTAPAAPTQIVASGEVGR